MVKVKRFLLKERTGLNTGFLEGSNEKDRSFSTSIILLYRVRNENRPSLKDLYKSIRLRSREDIERRYRHGRNTSYDPVLTGKKEGSYRQHGW